jgi:adenylate cyclase
VAIEIERKFLLASDRWRAAVTNSVEIVQGYIAESDTSSVRVRIAGENGSLNIKGPTLGITRKEYEYDLPLADAREILSEFCAARVITKTRHHAEHKGHIWEIDEFAGRNAGLIVAEIELSSENEVFDRPGWLGDEVSGDPRYYNVCLVEQPYGSWQDG